LKIIACAIKICCDWCNEFIFEVVKEDCKMSVYKFEEVLNDLVNYFILGDVLLLKSWQEQNNLPNDLATVFTTTDDVDNAIADGILLPMAGINNYPYTIIFNLSNDTPELLKEENQLQFRQEGYSLKVENNMLVLFTWLILSQFSDDNVNQLVDSHKKYKKPIIELENGWYNVDILGGETLQEKSVYNEKIDSMVQFSELEPTFEFVLKKTNNQERRNIDINFNFSIESSSYKVKL